MIEELQLVFMIRNKGGVEELDFIYTSKYINIIVKLLQWYQYKNMNLVYDCKKR